MIFPDIRLEDWLKKYPELDLLEKECDSCGRTMIANVPFITKGFAGVISPNCQCGKNRTICSSRVTTSSEEHIKWSKLLSVSYS